MQAVAGAAGVTAATPRAFAVLGDSDSHSYQDRVVIGTDGAARGGAFRSTTFQWNEVLARLRPADLDPGPWGVRGTSRTVARVRQWFGLSTRTPRKEDYAFNFAVSGAVCADLVEGPRAQARALRHVMDEDPARWRDGVVVIRIGVNRFGQFEGLDALARGDPDGAVAERIDGCVRAIDAAVALLRQAHPTVAVVLVGIFDNANWPPFFVHWRSPEALARVTAGLDRFDAALRARAAADPRIAFFDDRQWFARRWGARDGAGRPAYRSVPVPGTTLVVSNTAGDSPDHGVVADGHTGLVWNALWAAALVDTLRARLALPIAAISDDEAFAFVRATLAAPPRALSGAAVAAP